MSTGTDIFSSQLPPRGGSDLLGRFSSWSPLVDFTTSDEFSGRSDDAQQDKTIVPWQQDEMRRPDRIFATCEDGTEGSITEFRYGLRANISLDIDYQKGMKRAWLLPNPHGYLLLVSLPDSSEVFRVLSDFTSAVNLTEDDSIPYDLTSTTLTLACFSDLTVQITNTNIVLALEGGRRYGHPTHDTSFNLRLTPEQRSVAVSRTPGLVGCRGFGRKCARRLCRYLGALGFSVPDPYLQDRYGQSCAHPRSHVRY